jgi:hypothetical protein
MVTQVDVGGHDEMRESLRWWMLPVGGAAVAVALALVLAHEAGFPLDDSWIHQDFARTLATTGQFAFQPGHGGAGSTAPLWVLLLVPPHLMTGGHAPIWLLVGWSALLGTASLAGLGVVAGLLAADLARRAGGGDSVAGLAAALAGLAVVSEWHLVWAAVSGMETDLSALLGMLLILGISRGLRPLWLGLLVGISVAVRPEALLLGTLVAVAGAGVVVREALVPVCPALSTGAPSRGVPTRSPLPRLALDTGRATLPRLGVWARAWLAPYAVGALIGIVPYVLLNLGVSGRALPSTLYAKNAVYSREASSLVGLASYAESVVVVVLFSSVTMVGLAALSCFRMLLARHDKQGGMVRHAATVSASSSLRSLLWLWPVALVLAYAGHTVTALHHGRYLMPALPALLVLGAAGAAPLLLDTRRWRLALVGGGILALLGAVSLVRAGQIYADNVHEIDGTQVATAAWLRQHTSPRALIATHDIGAITYFSDRPVQDTEGLVDPGIIPLLGNQPAIEAYLRRRHVAYVAMYLDWYPPPATLAHDLAGRAIHRTDDGNLFLVYLTGW